MTEEEIKLATEIIEKNWQRDFVVIGMTKSKLTPKSIEFILKSIKEFNDLKQ